MITAQQPARTPDRSGTRPIRIGVVEDLDALRPRRAEWNALVERSETNTVFQTFEWHASWWKAFGDDVRPFVVLADADGELAGIAPLMLSKRRFLGRRRRVIEFIGTRSSDYCDFLVDPARPQVLPLMLRCLIENQRDWDLLHFSGIPDSSTTLRVLPKFFNQCGRLSHTRQLYEAPTHLFGDSIADRQLVRKKSLRRNFNCLRRQGRLEFKNYTAPEEIAACLDVFFQQHIRRRALTDCPSEFLSERERIFCKEVAQALAPTRWLLFSAVLLNQKPIAFHFGFEYGNRIIWYKPTFDVDYSKHSPGEVLIKYLLEYAAERKVAEFDFGIGQEAFKYRFANQVRVTYAVRVFHRTMPYHLDRLLEDARALVKGRPTLLRLGHRLLYRWRIHRWS